MASQKISISVEDLDLLILRGLCKARGLSLSAAVRFIVRDWNADQEHGDFMTLDAEGA